MKQQSKLQKKPANENRKGLKGRKREGCTHQITITCRWLPSLLKSMTMVSFALIISLAVKIT